MKLNRTLAPLFLFLLFFGIIVSSSESQEDESWRLSLDGIWDFACDVKDEGESAKWFAPNYPLPSEVLPGHAPKVPGKIHVPGAWDNQGYGTATEKVKHHFSGKGWYKKTVMVPKSWNGNRIFLKFDGICRRVKVWLDGQQIGGEAVGYIGPHQYDLTDHITFGKECELTVCVDSRQNWVDDALYGCANISDYMEIPWGGIWGHVTITARPRIRLDDLYLRTDVAANQCHVQVNIIDEQGTDRVDRILVEIIDLSGNTIRSEEMPISLSGQKSSSVSIAVPLTTIRLWTPEEPNLYNVRVILLDGDRVLDVVTTRFGFREITFDGYKILLNGKRIFLSGYGDDQIYPIEYAMSVDKEMYRQRMKLVKAFGFNHVRLHSSIMPHEYYEACDELGILCNAEFSVAYPRMLPEKGRTWTANVPKGTNSEIAFNTFRERFTSCVKEYRNHPSIFCWVGGNECSMYPGTIDLPIWADMMAISKQYDPSRPFVDTDGDFWTWHEYYKDFHRPTCEMNMLLFREWDSPIENESKFNVSGMTRPVISHEAGNYIMFPRLDTFELFDKSETNFYPFWATEARRRLRKSGLEKETEQWSLASEKLYLLHHKYNIEQLRLNTEMSGYHWWLIQDYYTTCNGLFDYFFRPKSITPAQVLTFNGSVVLLQRGLKRTCRSGDALDFILYVSNYGNVPLSGKVEVRLSASPNEQGKVAFADLVKYIQTEELKTGEVSEIGKNRFAMPNVDKPTEVVVKVSLKNEDLKIVNQWKIWLYPEQCPIESEEKFSKIYSDYTKELFPVNWNVQPIPNDEILPTNAVYITSWPDKRMTAALERGAGVILLDGMQGLTTIGNNYKSSWWRAGVSRMANTSGTLVYPNEITKGLVAEDWLDLQWFDLMQGSRMFLIDDLTYKPEILIRGLPSMMLVEDYALLLEVTVGKGILIVSGFNHHETCGRPENEWLVSRMISRSRSSRLPAAQWERSYLDSLVQDQNDQTIWGFQRIVSNGAIWLAGPSWFEEKVAYISVTQTAKNARVAWETNRVPKTCRDKPVTFVFSGGLGFSSQPKSRGYILRWNGDDLISFDVPEANDKNPVWKSKDGKSELRLEPKVRKSQDCYGLFYLTVPAERVQPGKTHRIEVQSCAQESMRWFQIDSYGKMPVK